MLRPIYTASDINIGDIIGGRDLTHVWTVQAKIDDKLIVQRYDKLGVSRKNDVSIKGALTPAYCGAPIRAYVVGNANNS